MSNNKAKAKVAKTLKKRKAKNDIVYLVSWYGRGQTLISVNIVKDRENLQKYIDKTLARIPLTGHTVQTKGDSPDYFASFDASDNFSGIFIRAKKVNNTLREADILNPLGTK